jgi:hypothetical protein
MEAFNGDEEALYINFEVGSPDSCFRLSFNHSYQNYL